MPALARAVNEYAGAAALPEAFSTLLEVVSDGVMETDVGEMVMFNDPFVAKPRVLVVYQYMPVFGAPVNE
jgi:hypothetical protein